MQFIVLWNHTMKCHNWGRHGKGLRVSAHFFIFIMLKPRGASYLPLPYEPDVSTGTLLPLGLESPQSCLRRASRRHPLR